MKMNDHILKLIESASTFEFCDVACLAIEEVYYKGEYHTYENIK
jgi:hypothetical protein